MTMQHSKMAGTVHGAIINSTLAGLESQATSESARASNGAGLKTGTKTNFSGQYLFDRFVANDKTEVTKLGIVRQMVSQLDTETFKKCIVDFVGVAKGFYDNAVKAAKDAGTYDEAAPSMAIAQASAKWKTAQNHQTVMRIAYGALKFAEAELTALGYNDQTGYQVMRVLGKKALEKKNIKWDGTPMAAKEDKAAAVEAKLESKALAEVMAATPRKQGESLPAYIERTESQIDARVSAIKTEAADKHRADVIAKIIALAGDDLDDIIGALLEKQNAPAEGSENAE